MMDAFSMPFMQRALAGGLLAALLASYYGPFLVQRGLSFLGSGLAHAAFGGVALGLLLGAQPLWVALPFTVAVALAIVWVRQRTGLKDDTAVGILFAVSMALGVVFISLKTGYTGEIQAILFGSVLYVTPADLYLAGGVAVASLLTLPLWGRWAYATFDRSLAQADGVPTQRDDYLLAACLAVAIVVSIKIVGMVLAAAFLVLPPAFARLVAPTFSRMTVYSVLFGSATVAAGLALSYAVNLPSGPVIILLEAALFFTALALPRRGAH